jgi:hypothetical protein
MQITPDERPFAYSGSNVVTLFSEDMLPVDIKKQSREYYCNFSMCVTRRVTFAPHDRQYNPLYLDYFKSLSSMSELLSLCIDNNTSIQSSINSSILNSISTMITTIELVSIGNEEINDNIGNMLNGTTSIEPIKLISLTTRPIPRNDDFFTAYSTKRSTTPSVEDDRIVVSGYSMLATFRGPKIIVPPFCV